MIVETTDPGVEGIREAVEQYLEKYPDYAGPIELYGAVMEIQQDALGRVACEMEISDEERERLLLTGEPLIDPLDVPVEGDLFREVVKRISNAVSESREGGSGRLGDLADWHGISDERLTETVEKVLGSEELDFTEGRAPEDREVVLRILWESLAPFYRKCGSILTVKMEQSSWLRGYCPVCGGAPLMGVFRQEDGLWLLECSLCHTLWNVRRAGCPYCPESEGSLEFLFIKGDEGKRVQYCKHCNTYVKTVDSRKSDQEATLPLEDIVTVTLDRAALEQGLKPAGGYS